MAVLSPDDVIQSTRVGMDGHRSLDDEIWQSMRTSVSEPIIETGRA